MTTLVLSLTQPWATLVAIGAKKIETRSWATRYRGPIAIHASMGFPKQCRDLFHQPPFHGVLVAAGFRSADDLPRGVLVSIGDLKDCISTTVDWPWPDSDEYKFGDYSPNRYGWRFDNMRRLKPIEVKGRLGLWTFPRDLVHDDFDLTTPHRSEVPP